LTTRWRGVYHSVRAKRDKGIRKEYVMEVIEAIRNRRSIRGFKPEPVPRKVLEELLDTCRWAPSAQNIQTWEIAVAGGNVMAEVKIRFEQMV
jgi:hypothetical protein